jgi:three-Cys-motif partner protein
MKIEDNFGMANEPSSDNWGGKWTQDKMEIFIKYLKVYLTIMKKYDHYELWYFDGFAGSGKIYDDSTQSFIEGIALKVLAIDEPKPFDHYYFVELAEAKANDLKKLIEEQFSDKKTYVVSEDCNSKLVGFANHLKKDSKKRGLAILDPYGMALDWSSLEALKDVYCDIWILVPTGLGFNRLLKRNGDISEAWMSKLENSLGISEDEIRKHFYKETTNLTLFGEEVHTEKTDKAIHKIANLYCDRLKTLWKFVSKPHEMKNSRGSTMFHFILASQVKAGVKIADDIIDSKNKK